MSAARKVGNLGNTTVLNVDFDATDVGINTATPNADFDIGGNILMDGPAGVVTATTFKGALSGNSTTATSATSATTATTATNAQGLTGTPSIVIQDLVGVGATFTGVLTYEDVTNIDAIGVVTARAGVDITGGTLGLSLGTGATAFSPASNTLTLGTNSAERLRIDSSGRLLLGTTTEGNTNADDLTIENSGEGGITIRTGASSNGNIFFSDATSGAGEYAGIIDYKHGSNAMTFGTSGAERLRIMSTGSIGINTSTGSNTVNIAGAEGVGVKFHNTTSGNLSYVTIESGDVLSSNVGGTGAYKWITGGSEKVRITNAGMLGIGTDLPVRKVTVAGDSATSIIELKRTNTNTTGAVGGLSWTAMDGHCVSTIYALGDGNDEGADLVFKTTTAAAANSPYDASLLERLKITSIGDIEFSGTATGVSSCTWDASANSLIFKDSVQATFGDGSDLAIKHDGTTGTINNTTGDIHIKTTGSGDDILLDSNDDIFIRVAGTESGIEVIGDGEVKLYHDSSLKFQTTATGVSIANTCSDAIGDVRSVPLQDESASDYTLVVSDKGQCVHAHGSTTAVTVNINTFAAGDVVSIVNGSGGNIAITQGTSFTLRNTADSSSGSLTLASFGMATIWFSGHNVGYISGSGLS